MNHRPLILHPRISGHRWAVYTPRQRFPAHLTAELNPGSERVGISSRWGNIEASKGEHLDQTPYGRSLFTGGGAVLWVGSTSLLFTSPIAAFISMAGGGRQLIGFTMWDTTWADVRATITVNGEEQFGYNLGHGDGSAYLLTGGPRGVEVWKNGILLTADPGTTTWADSLPAGAGFLDRGLAINYFNFGASALSDYPWALAAFASRQPSREEAARLSSNPWQFLFRDAAKAPTMVFFDTGLVQDTGDVVETTPVENDSTLQWLINSIVAANADFRWSLAGQILSDHELRWNLAQAVQQDREMRWNLATGVQRDTDIRYAILRALAKDASLPWHVLGPVLGDVDLRYNLLQAAERSNDLRWNRLAGVSLDSDLRWAMLQSAAQNFDARWAALQGAQRDTTALWNRLAPVARAVDSRWNILEEMLAANNVQLSWNVLATVSQQADLRWSLLTSIATNANLSWSLLAHAAASSDIRWDALASIAGDNTLAWAVRQGVVTDADIRWALIQAAKKDAALQWSMLSPALLKDLRLDWNILQAAARSIESQWSLLQSVGVTRDMRWRLVQAIARDASLRWHLFDVGDGQVAAIFTAQWHIVRAAENGVELEWRIGLAPGARVFVVPAENRVYTLEENRIFQVS